MIGHELCDEERAAIVASVAHLLLLTPGDFTAAVRPWELLDRFPAPAEFVEALRGECAIKPGGKHRPMGF